MNKYTVNDRHGNSGAHIIFENGVRVSIQFGVGSRCDGGKTTAEVAVIDDQDVWWVYNGSSLDPCPCGTEINKDVSPDDLASIMFLATKLNSI